MHFLHLYENKNLDYNWKISNKINRRRPWACTCASASVSSSFFPASSSCLYRASTTWSCSWRGGWAVALESRLPSLSSASQRERTISFDTLPKSFRLCPWMCPASPSRYRLCALESTWRHTWVSSPCSDGKPSSSSSIMTLRWSEPFLTSSSNLRHLCASSSFTIK